MKNFFFSSIFQVQFESKPDLNLGSFLRCWDVTIPSLDPNSKIQLKKELSSEKIIKLGKSDSRFLLMKFAHYIFRINITKISGPK